MHLWGRMYTYRYLLTCIHSLYIRMQTHTYLGVTSFLKKWKNSFIWLIWMSMFHLRKVYMYTLTYTCVCTLIHTVQNIFVTQMNECVLSTEGLLVWAHVYIHMHTHTYHWFELYTHISPLGIYAHFYMNTYVYALTFTDIFTLIHTSDSRYILLISLLGTYVHL